MNVIEDIRCRHHNTLSNAVVIDNFERAKVFWCSIHYCGLDTSINISFGGIDNV